MNARLFIFILFIGLSVLILSETARRYYADGDYIIYTTDTCDQKNGCFVSSCTEGDEDCDKTPYSKVLIRAQNAPQCVLSMTCTDNFCSNNKQCKKVLCDNQTVDKGEECVQ